MHVTDEMFDAACQVYDDMSRRPWREMMRAALEAALATALEPESDAMHPIRQAIVQARGALRLDAMVDGEGRSYGTTSVALEALDEAEQALGRLVSEQPGLSTDGARPLAEWHEDMGSCLWWIFPVSEPPYVGGPLDLGKPVEVVLRTDGVEHVQQYNVGGWPGYHTHFTRLLVPNSTP